MAEPLLIVGAGGFGRETAAAVRELPDFDLLGFLDDDPARHGQEVAGRPVLGPAEAVHAHPDARVVVCTGSPRSYDTRRVLVERLAIAPDRYATVVHPRASIGSGTALGAGSVVLAGVVTTTDVLVGSHVAVMPGVTLTHDDVVGDYATFGSGVLLGGGVTVATGAYVGAGAMVREGCTIGRGSLVGMGAVVVRDVPDDEVWAGSPARYLRPAGHPTTVGSSDGPDAREMIP